MAVWGSSWDRLRPYPPLPASRLTRPKNGAPSGAPSPLFALPDCLFPQLLAVQTACSSSTTKACSSSSSSSSTSGSSSSSSAPYCVFLNEAFLERAPEGTGMSAASPPSKLDSAAGAAAAAAANSSKAASQGEESAAAVAAGAPTAATGAAEAAAEEEEEALLEWARNEASFFEGPLGGDVRSPARPFCCSLWRDKVLGVGGPAHLGGALHLWDAASGCLCSSSVSPQSQQRTCCIAPDPRGAPVALTGGYAPSRGAQALERAAAGAAPAAAAHVASAAASASASAPAATTAAAAAAAGAVHLTALVLREDL
ncbi:hypothetical protein Emed_002062 [Eimeria media]